MLRRRRVGRRVEHHQLVGDVAERDRPATPGGEGDEARPPVSLSGVAPLGRIVPGLCTWPGVPCTGNAVTASTSSMNGSHCRNDSCRSVMSTTLGRRISCALRGARA